MDPATRHDLIVAIPGILAAAGTIFNAYFSRSLKVHINSRMTEMMNSVRGEATAAGMAAGIESERTRVKE
jgi:hypothetical protein